MIAAFQFPLVVVLLVGSLVASSDGVSVEECIKMCHRQYTTCIRPNPIIMHPELLSYCDERRVACIAACMKNKNNQQRQGKCPATGLWSSTDCHWSVIVVRLSLVCDRRHTVTGLWSSTDCHQSVIVVRLSLACDRRQTVTRLWSSLDCHWPLIVDRLSPVSDRRQSVTGLWSSTDFHRSLIVDRLSLVCDRQQTVTRLWSSLDCHWPLIVDRLSLVCDRRQTVTGLWSPSDCHRRLNVARRQTDTSPWSSSDCHWPVIVVRLSLVCDRRQTVTGFWSSGGRAALHSSLRTEIERYSEDVPLILIGLYSVEADSIIRTRAAVISSTLQQTNSELSEFNNSDSHNDLFRYRQFHRRDYYY